ncbi:type IV toxin-antitoxin system AbiEi family antitoxin [Luteirhabdus pelagi]|uniref:type IV toxin-antitoxin system AbiEi family antitoxin n=1 Tax=Luteirhabdus pelagi TaxID=2792783 RepID=UPI00193A3CE5|nr:type IV toxin-antitoxin system AbiEi family antitoxin [Luteirhabdus pelagi]
MDAYIKSKDFLDALDIGLLIKQSTKNNELAETRFTVNGEAISAITKRDTRPQHISLIENLAINIDNFLLVSDYITPNAKKELKKRNINYVDSFGNAFLNLKTTKVYIEKGNAKPVFNQYSKVFTQAGGQILFQLLQDPDKINETYRRLAEISKVSLGSVSKFINGLHDEGYIVQWNNDKKYQLVKRAELLDRWIILVNEKILPAYRIGTFHFRGQENLVIKENDQEFETRWGGEAGAASITNYLNPTVYSLFTNRQKKDLIKNFRLIPDNNGEITVYNLFWKQGSINYDYDDVAAHPLLIYAELMYSGNERNIETAQILYNEYIAPKL